ncbi:NAD-dependent epimerase/dehydratase family protein [Vibrio scophthalmi]|uniref:NAD-dependent epimerase/dehydratase family protein n=1 Tax=Vibrio scophthalmi TaxID=45658 RepID=UPI003EBBC7EF
MKVAILGGGGFIGSAIVDRLLKDGHELRIFVRARINPEQQSYDHENVEWFTGDISCVSDVNMVIEGVDVVIHLVSTTLPKSSNNNPIYDVQSNIVSTLQILDSMVENNIKKIIFISSGGTVYGDPEYLPIDERHPTEPRVSYGITKLAIEKYLLMYQKKHGIKVNILRVTNPYGERQRVEAAQGAIGVFLNKSLLNQPIEIWGDGEVIRDYIYVKDVAEAFACAISYEGSQSVFNISSGIGTTLNELISIIERTLGREIGKTYRPGRSFDVPVSVLDNSLAFRELGWQPKVDIGNGIAKTATWLQDELNK